MWTIENVESAALECLARLVDRPGDFGLLVIGSLAHGLETDRSDIDVIAIDFSGANYGEPVRQLTHIGSQRCEMFFASPKDLADLCQAVTASSSETAFSNAGFNFELFVNIAFGKAITRKADVDNAIADFTPREAAARTSQVHLSQRDAKRWEAEVFDWLGLHQLAASSAREAIGRHLKHLVSREARFPCLGDKKLEQQIDICGLMSEEMARLVQLWRMRPPYPPLAYVADALLALPGGRADIGDTLCTFGDLRMLPLVTGSVLEGNGGTWLVRPGREERVGGLLARIPCRITDLEHCCRASIRELFLGGEASFAHHGNLLTRKGMPDARRCADISITFSGHEWTGSGKGDLLSLKVGHSVIASRATEVIVHGILFANLREDAVGAIRLQNWRQVDSCFRQMVFSLVRTVLASLGHPTMERGLIDEGWAMHLLSRRDECRGHLSNAKRALEIEVANAAMARAAFDRICTLRNQLSDGIWGDVERSMENGNAHLFAVVHLPNEWARIRLEAGTLTEDLGANRRRMMDSEGTFGTLQRRASLDWNRADDIRNELDRCLAEASGKSSQPTEA